jgi:hypothetical protein
MKMTTALCAALVCLVSEPGVAAPHGGRGPYAYLFDDAAPRPPRSVPFGRSRRSADELPLPRPRPDAAPAEISAASPRPAAPPVHPTAVTFPPVAPLE